MKTWVRGETGLLEERQLDQAPRVYGAWGDLIFEHHTMVLNLRRPTNRWTVPDLEDLMNFARQRTIMYAGVSPWALLDEQHT